MNSGKWKVESVRKQSDNVGACNLVRKERENQRQIINPKSKIQNPKSEAGMSLLAVLAVMTLFAIALLAVAPTVQQGIERDKELESISRGEEVADAIKQYVAYYGGAKLPNSMDDLLEGLPQGTKKRQILRPSAMIDPLSEDGKWRLVKPDSKAFVDFGRRVQTFNGGILPGSPPQLQRFALPLVNLIGTQTDDDAIETDEEIDAETENTPFIGVVSQSRKHSVIAYYGIETPGKWIFTPLFRGAGANSTVMPQNQRGNFNRTRPPTNIP